MNSTADRIDEQSQKDPDRLEREIDQQREHISGIVDALENKLSPGQMFDRMLEFGKGNGREIAENFGNTVKAHPVPTLLTAVGLAWLYATRNEPAAPRPMNGRSTYVPTRPGTLERGAQGLGEKAHQLGDQAHGAMDRAREMGEDVSHSVSETWNETRARVGDASARLTDTAHRAGATLNEQKDRVVEGYNRMLDENPLALGAIGIAAGALLGAMLPRTETEDRWMGETRDDLVGQAREAVHAGAEKASEAVHGMGEPDRGVRH